MSLVECKRCGEGMTLRGSGFSGSENYYFYCSKCGKWDGEQ